jgi:hypothetical protein
MTKEEGIIHEGNCASPHASNALCMARELAAGRTRSPHRSTGALPSSGSAVLSADDL